MLSTTMNGLLDNQITILNTPELIYANLRFTVKMVHLNFNFIETLNNTDQHTVQKLKFHEISGDFQTIIRENNTLCICFELQHHN